jgi:glycosyltransferase involved in cell wall biosynthesis
MKSPLVSVVMAAKNGEKYIVEAIESILSQDYWPYEIILIDGQSTDKTAEIAKSYDQIRYILQSGKGIADAYNLGIDSASGEFISFLSVDDYWTPNKLSVQIGYMITHPEFQYTVAMVRYFLADGCSVPAAFDEQFLDKDIQAGGVESLVVRRELFDNIGRFDPNFTIGEDLDWYARAIDTQILMAVIPEVLLYKRVHDASITIREASQFNQILLRIMHGSLKRKRNKC